MKLTPRALRCATAALALVAASACSSSGGGGADTTGGDVAPDTAAAGDTSGVDTTAADAASGPLTVASRTPDGAAAVSPHAAIVVTFDRTIDPASVSSDSFALTAGDDVRYGEFTVDGGVVTLTPDYPLTNATTYTVTLTTDITAAAGGVALEAPVTWTFDTLAGIGIVSVEPEAGTENVSSTAAVRVIFDTPITAASVTAESFQVRSSGWVDNVYYEGAALPGSVRVIDEEGITSSEGVMIQWYPTGGMPEYGVRVDVVVTRDVRTADGASLDADFESSFFTSVLDQAYYYRLRVEGFDDNWVLGVHGDTVRMIEDGSGPSVDWYVVHLNNGGYGLWNRETGKALKEYGADTPAQVETWQGIFAQAWELDSYGGKPGVRKPHESYRVYNLLSGSSDSQYLTVGFVDQQTALFMKEQRALIYALWYFTRGERR